MGGDRTSSKSSSSCSSPFLSKLVSIANSVVVSPAVDFSTPLILVVTTVVASFWDGKAGEFEHWLLFILAMFYPDHKAYT